MRIVLTLAAMKLCLFSLALALGACASAPPPAPSPRPVPDAEQIAFLTPRDGEEALRAPRLSADDTDALARCENGRGAKVDARCKELAVEDLRVGHAQEMERGAREHVVLLARALSGAQIACGTGPVNPPTSEGPFVFDGPGWSCVAAALGPDERQRLTGTFGHAYSFVVDERLSTYEVVARGPSSELVLRGRLGEEPDARAMLRRAAPSITRDTSQAR
jgi:hypothetical protein